MPNIGTLQVIAPGERDIVMTRAFNAPRQLVWDAHTQPELVKRWLGVHNGWALDVCDIDLRVGGAYRYVWRGPGGQEMGMGGSFLEIKSPAKLVATERFDQSWYPGGAVDTTEFSERDGRTTLTITIHYDSRDARDAVLETPMEQGMAAGYDALDGVLLTLTRAER